MPSFATEVKNELARLMYDKECCRTAELAALLRMGAAISIGAAHALGINFTTENAAVARKALTLLKETGDVRTEIMVSRSRRLKKNNSYCVRVLPSPKVSALLERLGLMHGASFNVGTDSALLRRQCCRIAYLRGAFLGGGSVNRPDAGCHLELVTGSYSFAELLASLLKKLDLPAGLTDRKNDYVVYITEGEAILDFLGMLEAEQAVEEFEVTRNLKEVRNQVNRLVNCETANLQKTVDAAGRQIARIQTLAGAGRLRGLPDTLRETAEARLAHPDATLSELAALLKVGKSGINHRLRKLEKLAADLIEGE